MSGPFLRAQTGKTHTQAAFPRNCSRQFSSRMEYAPQLPTIAAAGHLSAVRMQPERAGRRRSRPSGIRNGGVEIIVNVIADAVEDQRLRRTVEPAVAQRGILQRHILAEQRGRDSNLTEVFQQARNAVLDSLLRQIAMVIESLSGRVLREERFIWPRERKQRNKNAQRL